MGIKITLSTSIWFSIGFLIMFTFGGAVGIILGNAAMDVTLHDSYYVVAHFHFVLSLGAITALFAGLYYYVTLMQNFAIIPCYTSHHSKLYCSTILAGILLTFFPMYFLGFNFQPRRMS